MIDAQEDVVRWWDANVRMGRPKSSADSALLSQADAEKILGYGHQQISRWWRERVRGDGRPSKTVADRGQLSATDAESLTGITKQQVSRWWRERVSVSHGAGRGKKGAVRGAFSLADAEQLTGITHQQVSRWANKNTSHASDPFLDKDAQALDETDYSLTTLQHAKWVAGAIEPCRRLQDCSWQIHHEVAGLDPEERDAVLQTAAEPHTVAKYRATRRIGEISRELEKAPQAAGGRHPNGGKPTKTAILKSAGISTSAAHRAERLAILALDLLPHFESEAKMRQAHGQTAPGKTLREKIPYPLTDKQQTKIDRVLGQLRAGAITRDESNQRIAEIDPHWASRAQPQESIWKGKASEQAADAVGVNPRYVSDAKRISKQGGSRFAEFAKARFGMAKARASMWVTIGENIKLFSNAEQFSADWTAFYEFTRLAVAW